MAAHKQQNQRVIWVHVHVWLDFVGKHHGLGIPRDRGLPLAASNFTAHLICHPARCDLNQPAAWILGNTISRPLYERCDQRLLYSVLGRREIAKSAHDGSEHLWSEFAQQVLIERIRQGLYHGSSLAPTLIPCRTSMGIFKGNPPGPGAADQIAAISYARSVVSTSTIK